MKLDLVGSMKAGFVGGVEFTSVLIIFVFRFVGFGFHAAWPDEVSQGSFWRLRRVPRSPWLFVNR